MMAEAVKSSLDNKAGEISRFSTSGEERSGYPPSASSFPINFSAGIIFMLSVWGSHRLFHWHLGLLTLVAIIIPFLWVIAMEVLFLQVHKRKRVGFRLGIPRDTDQIMVKLAAFCFCLALSIWFLIGMDRMMALFFLKYNFLFYSEFFYFFAPLSLIVLIIGGFYIYACNAALGNPQDSLWHLGNLVLGRRRALDLHAALSCIKSVLLRIYFLPLMFVGLINDIDILTGNLRTHIAGSLPLGENTLDVFMPLLTVYFFFSAIDVLFGFLGYMGAFKLFDSDIQATDPTVKGWFVCLICYEPFFKGILEPLLFYRLFSNPVWFKWLAGFPILGVLWGSSIILAMCAESFVPLSFGIRFSNLTYRGLISNGLFRWTKHPQYISKMLNRFMFYIPVLSMNGIKGSFLNIAIFGLLCFMYFLRARTEENFLSRYPEYLAYAKVIDKKGIFRFLNPLFPFLRFSAERAQADRIF